MTLHFTIIFLILWAISAFPLTFPFLCGAIIALVADLVLPRISVKTNS